MGELTILPPATPSTETSTSPRSPLASRTVRPPPPETDSTRRTPSPSSVVPVPPPPHARPKLLSSSVPPPSSLAPLPSPPPSLSEERLQKQTSLTVLQPSLRCCYV